MSINYEELVQMSQFTPRHLAIKDGWAWVGHLPFAWWLMRELKPAVYVELGTHTGNSYFCFCESVLENNLTTQCHAIDHWDGDPQAGHYGDQIYQQVQKANQPYESFSTLHRESFDDALSHFDDHSIELLHIDGLHTYEAVSHDYHSWLRKLAPNAIILLHDTEVIRSDFGVRSFWEELLDSHPYHLNFRHSNGLGVLQHCQDASRPPLFPWLAPQSPEQQTILAYFESIGQKFSRPPHITHLEQKYHEVLQERNQFESDLTQLLHSRSWKATQPLRRAGRLLRKVKRRLKRISGRHHLTEKEYQRWIKKYDLHNTDSPASVPTDTQEQNDALIISVLVPVYNPPIEFLKEAIESVISQSYKHWELCLADDLSTDPEVRRTLEAYENKDPRIKVVYRETNGHISEATNSALQIASGDYIALLDHDDLLTPDALAIVAESIKQYPGANLFYSDEDKLSPQGKRTDPYFKSAWNPYLFLGHNMICHLSTYRKSLVQELGGFRSEFNGAQDYDLAARVIQSSERDQIIHIPRILYHWRILPGSTALGPGEKSYALEASTNALNDYLKTSDTDAYVTADTDLACHRAHFNIRGQTPSVTIVIPTYNHHGLVKTCIDSILDKSTYDHYDILLVDNNSNDPASLAYFEQLNQHTRINMIQDPRDFNYSAINNNAIFNHTESEYVCLLNNDIEVITPNWIEEMLGIASQPDVGAAGAKLLYPNRTIQHAGVIGICNLASHAHKGFQEDQHGYFNRMKLTQMYSAVTAACLMVKRDRYLEVSGLDEEQFAVALNDVDFCLKLLAAGYYNVWTPHAVLFHHESVSRGYEVTPEKKARFEKESQNLRDKWPSWINHDPYYNPNLSPDDDNFTLAFPPGSDRTARTNFPFTP